MAFSRTEYESNRCVDRQKLTEHGAQTSVLHLMRRAKLGAYEGQFTVCVSSALRSLGSPCCLVQVIPYPLVSPSFFRLIQIPLLSHYSCIVDPIDTEG